jgi:hypothetical protein
MTTADELGRSANSAIMIGGMIMIGGATMIGAIAEMIRDHSFPGIPSGTGTRHSMEIIPLRRRSAMMIARIRGGGASARRIAPDVRPRTSPSRVRTVRQP